MCSAIAPLEAIGPQPIIGGRFIWILLTGRITKWVRPGMTHLASLPDKGSPASSLFKDDFSLMVSGSVGQVSPVRVASARSLEIGRLAAGATFRRSHAADNVPRRLGCRASQAFTQHHRDLLQRSEDLSASQSRRREVLSAPRQLGPGLGSHSRQSFWPFRSLTQSFMLCMPTSPYSAARLVLRLTESMAHNAWYWALSRMRSTAPLGSSSWAGRRTRRSS